MQRRRAVRAAGLGVAGALALAGCASEPPSVGEAWHQARTQLDEAETVRIEAASIAGNDNNGAIRWNSAGRLDGGDGVSTVRMRVGQDSHVTLETRRVGGDVYTRLSSDGDDVPEPMQQTSAEGRWEKSSADQAQDQTVSSLLEMIPLPAADALDDADVEPERIDWRGDTAHRYTVPEGVAQSTGGGRDGATLRAFIVDEDGNLAALTVDDGRSDQQFVFSDWNAIDPAQAPEEGSD